MPRLSAQDRPRRIELLLFDVDGVLTDGKLFIFPAPAGAAQPRVASKQSRAASGEDARLLILPPDPAS